MDAETKLIVEQADAAYDGGRFDLAEALYRQALAAQPGMARVQGQLGLIALWRNDLSTAEGYLKAARRHRPWWARLWPMTAPVDYRLALVYGRAGRPHDAAAMWRKAAGVLPYGPFKSLKVNADQMALFDEATFYRIQGPDEVAVPFDLTDPLPVVQVSVNGAAPVHFFIDTGGEGVSLDRAYAAEVAAEIVGEYPGEYAGGKSALTGYGRLDELRLGDLQVSNIPVSTIDLAATSRRVFDGMPVSGIIGTGFLMRFLATLDYPNQRLLLRHKEMTGNQIDRELGLHGQELIIPMWLVESHLIFAEGSVNGLETLPMLIDTGLAGAAFMTSQAIYRAAGVEMDWSRAGVGAGGGGEVRGLTVAVDQLVLGRGDKALRKAGLTGVATEQDNSLFTGAAGFRVGGLISHQFFREHALTFDFRGMRLIVQ